MKTTRLHIGVFLLGLCAVALPLRAGETITVRLSRRLRVNDRVELKFTLNKPKGQKAYFIGTGPTSPAYELQVQENGQWQDYVGGGWCANALDIQAMSTRAGQLKMAINPAFARGAVFRVGVRIFRQKPAWNPDGTANLPKSTVIWSDPAPS